MNLRVRALRSSVGVALACVAGTAFAQGAFYINALGVVINPPITCTSTTVAAASASGTVTFYLPSTNPNYRATLTVNGAVVSTQTSQLPGPYPGSLPATGLYISVPPTTPPYTYAADSLPLDGATTTGVGFRISGTCNADGSATAIVSPLAAQTVAVAVPTLGALPLALLAIGISVAGAGALGLRRAT